MLILKIDVDLKLKLLKGLMTAAHITGSGQVQMKGELLAKGVVKKMLIHQLKKQGLTGTVTVDGDTLYIEADDNKVN